MNERLKRLIHDQNMLLDKPNKTAEDNGFVQRYENPILTSKHIPVQWKYDLNPITNPFAMERLGINAVFNAGAIKIRDKYILVVRVEGYDRKSFFAIAESENGIEKFRFRETPILLPETEDPDTNVYDMRLTLHEDGWIYGLFCTERRPKEAPVHDQSIAEAKCGIVRTKDLKVWERLNDLDSGSNQQRNVVLHPEFVKGKYALYTRPQDGFINAGKGGGIGWSLIESMEQAVVANELVIDPKVYHTIKELKNGQGPAPIKTKEGWIHLAHGVRNTAAGLRYVLYLFMTSLDDPSKVIHTPGGYFLAPEQEERIGDVSNVLFSNGWVNDEDGRVLIYYASSDTRLHVASSSIERLIDYCKNTPKDRHTSFNSVEDRINLIQQNSNYLQSNSINIDEL